MSTEQIHIRLRDLNPSFVDAAGEPRRTGVGVMFDCPRGCGRRHYVAFSNPLDGGHAIAGERGWLRDGDTIDTLTLAPSINLGCWHGFIANGAAL